MPPFEITPPRPLRIALFTHSVNPRGGVVHTLELADALHAAGQQVTVFAPAQQDQALFRGTRCAVRLVTVRAERGGGMPAMVERRIDALVAHLSALLAAPAQRFDVYHAQDSISANALATLREQSLVPGFTRTVHHLDHFDDARLMAWQQRGFMQASQVFCVSRLWQHVMAAGHGIDAALVRNGVDLLRYTPAPVPRDGEVAARLGLRPGAPLVLAVGGVEERKNTVRLLQAFASLRTTLPHAQLVVAGGASLLDHGAYAQSFRAALAANGLHQGPGREVLLTGTVADMDMPALFRLADVLAMPSLREGFGLVVLEALASGTPVVVSHIAPFTEYLDGAPVAWADPLDPASICEALHAALRRPAFALPPVCEDWSWQRSAATHLALYRDAATTQSFNTLAPRQTLAPREATH